MVVVEAVAETPSGFVDRSWIAGVGCLVYIGGVFACALSHVVDLRFRTTMRRN